MSDCMKVFHFIIPPPVKPEGTIGLHSVRQSVRHTHFPDFFGYAFTNWMEVGRKLLYESCRTNSTFVTVDRLFSCVIALRSKFFFRNFLGYAFTYLNESW